jgi:single-strand DNA-binding protein
MITINITGNITGDAITRTINNITVINFTIAHNNRYKTSQGELKEEVTFIRCSIWDKPNLHKLFYKGRSIYASGFLKLNKYTDSNGEKQAALNLTITAFKVFGKAQQQNPKPDNTKVFPDESHAFVDAVIEEQQQQETFKDLPF